MTIRLSISASVAVLLSQLCAFGAGYQIIEQGAANMGTAMAGSTANANNDASAAFWNPSAAAFMPISAGETRIDFSAAAVIPKLCFVDSGSTGPFIGGNPDGNCAVNEIVPNFYAVHKFTDDLAATLSVTAPYGLESDYQCGWTGQIQALRSYLFTTDINPSVSYKVTDWLAINGGVSAQFAYCTLSQYAGVGIFDLTGQSWSVGGNAGFTVEYDDNNGRFGFQWRSAVKHTLSGNAHMNDNVVAAITADMTMPDTFTAGVYQRLHGDFDQFAVMAEYAYTRWSVFDQLAVSGISSAPIQENWKDTSRIALGFHYYPKQIENLTLRLGSSFDESPVPSAQFRTARIPCSDRVWLSTGIGYKYDRFSFDLAYTYIFVVGNSDINRTETFAGTQNTLSGSYYAHINVIAAQIGYEF